MKNFKLSINRIIRLPIVVGVIILIVLIVLKLGGAFREPETTIITEATLIDTVDVAELSTAEFTYNGIADIPETTDPSKVKCRVRYEAKVKASVDMEDIKFEIDDEKKTVKPLLPEITLTPVLEEQAGFSYIPVDAEADLEEVIEACQADVAGEAEKNADLRESAEENLKDIIQALTYPVISAKGYTLVWE